LREEQVNKKIMRGSQQTIEKLFGTRANPPPPPKASRNIVPLKEVVPNFRINKDFGLLELQGFR
jgi:hypothetical protein